MLTVEERIKLRYRKDNELAMSDIRFTTFEHYLCLELDALNEKLNEYRREHDD